MRVLPEKLSLYRLVLRDNRGLATLIAKELGVKPPSITGFIQGRSYSQRIHAAIERHLKRLKVSSSPAPEKVAPKKKKPVMRPSSPRHKAFVEPAEELVA